jgi:membrane-bound inhibitor of C-type lysozyme
MRLGNLIFVAGTGAILLGPMPASADTLKTYRCQDNSEFVVALYDYERGRRAHVQLDGKALALPKRISVSGLRYSKGDISVTTTKAGVTTLKRGKRVTECSAS